MTSRTYKLLPTLSLICTLLTYGTAWGGNQPPLSQIPVPEPPNLGQFLKSDPITGKPTAAARTAAIQLGKALFWDMQAGSDGVQACASCHFHAGADNRLTNQINPGPDSTFANISTPPAPKRTFAPNYTLQPFADFPFFQLNPILAQIADLTAIDPLTGLVKATVARKLNDIVGSQGISFTDFLNINTGAVLDAGNPIPDPVFKDINGVNTRRVTGRNAPSVINAVFNYTNFWDGRANNIFNGENPFGPLDQAAGIYIDNGVTLVKQKVAIPNASLASQATGPPLNETEMSFKGRTFPELGKKLLSLPPLAKQHVDPNDSVLGGPLANAVLGLNANYSNMIKAAFQDNLTGTKAVNLPTKAFPLPNGEPFTQIQANFALFWGLAIQLYEATLVSDQTPFDRFQLGNQNALSPIAQKGLTTFDGKCIVCHTGSEFTSATVGSQVANANPVVFRNNTTHNLIQLSQTSILGGLSDTGFFNIGVRPTLDDPGRGGVAPFVNSLTSKPFPLSFSRLAELQAQVPTSQLPFVTPQLPAGTPPTQPDAVQGSFKVPGLRNVELTAPYFHNGSVFTLEDVVLFYGRGGNFTVDAAPVPVSANPELAFAMSTIASGGLRGKLVDVAAFLRALTDERVRQEKAPFDHPQLIIPNGNLPDIVLSATGGPLAPVLLQTLTMDPATTPTTLTSQVISGTVDDTATVAVSVNNLPPAAATVGGTVGGVAGGVAQAPNAWSFNVTGMKLGPNTIKITATSPTGDIKTIDPTTVPPTPIINVLPTATISGTPQIVTLQTGATLTVGGTGVDTYQFKVDGGAFNGADIPVATPITLSNLADGTHAVSIIGKNTALNLQQPAANATTVSWTVKANPPVLTINPLTTPTNRTSQTIGGTVELGLVPVVRADATVTIGPVTVVGGSGIGTWSCQVSGIRKGTINFTVTATDIAQNVTIRTTAITVVTPDGNIKGTGAVDTSDALKALRITVGVVTPTPEELLRGDVAPLDASGVPAPDGKIDISDAIVILKKAVGLVNF